jgi:hypothetical protein
MVVGGNSEILRKTMACVGAGAKQRDPLHIINIFAEINW